MFLFLRWPSSLCNGGVAFLLPFAINIFEKNIFIVPHISDQFYLQLSSCHRNFLPTSNISVFFPCPLGIHLSFFPYFLLCLSCLISDIWEFPALMLLGGGLKSDQHWWKNLKSLLTESHGSFRNSSNVPLFSGRTIQLTYTDFTAYSELEGMHKDHWVQPLTEWPLWGSGPQPWCFYSALSSWASITPRPLLRISHKTKKRKIVGWLFHRRTEYHMT